MIGEENQEGLDFVKNFRYADEYQSSVNKLFIMQVPQSILYEIQSKKEMSIISKDKNDIAKLVSNTETYKIKRFDYPNSYFLNYQVKEDYFVESTTKSVYFLEKLANQKDSLYKFLLKHQIKESFFGGDLNDPKLSNYGFEINDLMNDFFMSRKNLLEFCKEIGAINIGEKIYFLETEIFLKIFRELLNQLSCAQEKQQRCITLDMIAYIFPSINPEILQNVLFHFTKQLPSSAEEVDNQQFALTYEYICKFIMLELYLAKKEYYMDDFQEFVDKMLAVYVPESLNSAFTDSEKLIIRSKMKNKYFINFDTNSYQIPQGASLKKITVVAYDHYLYTFEPKERVTMLFEKKKNFFPTEFRDYLEVLNLQKKEQDDLVLNSCRAISISIHKKNHELFSTMYPSEHLNADKLNPENFSCKVYNNKKK